MAQAETAVLDRTAVAHVPSSKHRHAYCPTQQSRAMCCLMRRTIRQAHWEREESQIHLNAERKSFHSHPRCHQGYMLSLVCLTRSSNSLAGCVLCLASRCKGGFFAMNKLSSTYAERTGQKIKAWTRMVWNQILIATY